MITFVLIRHGHIKKKTFGKNQINNSQHHIWWSTPNSKIFGFFKNYSVNIYLFILIQFPFSLCIKLNNSNMLPFFSSTTGVGFVGEMVVSPGEPALPGTFGGILLAEWFCMNRCVKTFLLKATVEGQSGLDI